MLVHVCCSVDSHYFFQELMKCYPDEKMIAFFYNPNIHPKEEYDLRLLDVQRSCNKLGIELLEGDYNLISWLNETYGYENEEEKGVRCSICFDERLIHSAKIAMEIGESKLTTTLLASPMKSRDDLFAQGETIARKYDLEFIKIDVRANGGTQRQSKVAKDENLYRQNYCGCQYALKKQRDRSNKVAIELFSHIGNQILPGSAKHTINVFKEVQNLESIGRKYLLKKNTINLYRLLRGIVKHDGMIINSYIFTHSRSVKNLKSGDITWIERECEGIDIWLGYCDNALFIDLQSISHFFSKDYKNTTDMVYNPINYDDELDFRVKILGVISIKPLIVIDERVNGNLTINIESIFQNADIFELIKL